MFEKESSTELSTKNKIKFYHPIKNFEEVFDISEIQQLQDKFSDANGVASIIASPDGTPITKASNFSKLCQMIRHSAKGSKNCEMSDKIIGEPEGGIKIQTCLSCGLYDAAVPIFVEEQHIASWLIGQVRDDYINEEYIKKYAREINIPEKEAVSAFYEIPVMTKNKLKKIVDLLAIFTNQLSQIAYQNKSLEIAVSELSEKEEILIENKNKFDTLFSSMAELVGIWELVFDKFNVVSNYKLIDCNDSFTKIIGLSKDKIIGKLGTEIFNSQIPPYLHKYSEVLSSQNPIQITDYNKSLDKYFLISVVSGLKNQFATISIDITELRRIEENLKTSEKRFRNLIEGMPDIFFRINKDLIFLDCYTNKSEFLLIPENEIIGKNAKNILPPFLYDLTKTKLFDTLDNNKINFYDYSININDIIMWYEARMVPYSNKEALIIVRDITKEKEQKFALEISENRFKNLTENLIGVAYICDLDDKYSMSFITRNILEITGYTYKDFIDNKVYYADLIHPEFKEYVANEIKLADKEDGKFHLIYKLLNRDGQIKWIEENGTVVTRDNGKKELEGYLQDITLRKLAEEKVQENQNELEEKVKLRTKELDIINKELSSEIKKNKSNEIRLEEALKKEKEFSDLKTRFISMASHEFRTPLTTIKSSAELLEMFGKEWTDDKKEIQLGRIVKSVNHLTSILDDVLFIGRTERDKINIKPDEFDFAEMSKELIGDIKLLGNENHVYIYNFESSTNLIFGDEKLIRMVLSNLLVNAVKYSPEGGRIIFEICEINDSFKILIKDDGIGIPEEDQKLLYSTFHRGRNTDKLPGTGLGLSIVKNTVDKCMGTIKIKSKEGKGTKVKIQFPKKFKNIEGIN